VNLQSHIQTFIDTSLDAQEQLGLHTGENTFGEDLFSHNFHEMTTMPSCGGTWMLEAPYIT